MTSKSQRLHPVSLIIFAYESIKKLVFPMIIILLGIGRSTSMFWIVTIIFALVAIIMLSSVVNYLMFTYQILEDEIIIKSGVFVKKVNHVPYDRIQNVTTNQWFFLKPFGLEELEIETAGQSDKAEVQLKAVPDSLKNEINHLRNNETATKRVESVGNTYTISWRDLLKFSFTSPAFFSALLAISALYGKLKDAINQDVYQNVANKMVQLGFLIMIVIILLILLIFYLGSAAILISKYYHFQLVENDDQLQMTRGLFQTKKTSISTKRIQAVVVKQPLLRSLLGIATIQLVIVSNSKENDTEKDIVIMPVIAIKQVEQFLQQFLPQIPVKTMVFRPLAWTYYYELRNAFLWIVPIVGVLVWIFFSNPWLIMTIIILGLLFWSVPAILTARRSKAQILSKEYLVLQNNKFMTKQLNYIPKSRIQYIEKRSSLWLQRKDIASLLVYVRSGNGQRVFSVGYQTNSEISEIVDWYKTAD